MYTSEGKDDFSDAGEIYAEKKLTGCEVYGKKYLIMKHKGILEKKGTFIVEGYCTGADGPGYVRYHRLIEGANDE